MIWGNWLTLKDYFIIIVKLHVNFWNLGFPAGSEVKASACNAGDPGSIPGSGRSPDEGNGNPLQYSGLGNPMDRGAWWTIIHGVAKSWTQLSNKHLSSKIIQLSLRNSLHVANLFGTRDQFHGRSFFHRLGTGGRGWFQGVSRALHLLCTLFLLLHLPSQIIGQQISEVRASWPIAVAL